MSLVGLSLILTPLAASARNSDSQLRDCERTAMNNREQATVDNTRNFYNNKLQAYDDHRQRVFDAWGTENDRDRGNQIRSFDRDLQNALRAQDHDYQNVIRSIQTDFRNADRSCQNDLNQRLRDVPSGAACYVSDDCHPPLGMCTTETGDCRQVCRPGSDPCEMVCSGRCRLR